LSKFNGLFLPFLDHPPHDLFILSVFVLWRVFMRQISFSCGPCLTLIDVCAETIGLSTHHYRVGQKK